MAEQKPKNALISIIDVKKESLWGLKASYLPKINQEVYFKRALITVMENKDLAAMSKTDAGAMSVLQAIGRALQMGLQIGGNIPQAYIVPFKDRDGVQRASLIPTAEGYRFICTAEPDPVLRDFDVRAVYDGEDFSLDFSSGSVRHSWDGKTKRGKLIGVYCKIEDLNGNRKVEYMTREEIERIRDTRSKFYINFKKGPWADDFDAMCLKTAAKKFLKPYAAMKEGLAMALAVDDGDPGRDDRSISDRVGDQLDGVLDAEFEHVSDPPQEGSSGVTQKPVAEQPPETAAKGGKKDIF